MLHFWLSLLHFWFVTFLVWFVTNVAIGRLPHPRSPLISRCPIVYLLEKKAKRSIRKQSNSFLCKKSIRKQSNSFPIHFFALGIRNHLRSDCWVYNTLFLNSTKCVLMANTITFTIFQNIFSNPSNIFLFKLWKVRYAVKIALHQSEADLC